MKRFYQTDPSPTRKHEGSGIGLALVRELVDLHGGENSRRKPAWSRGACFTVRLPLVAADFEQLTIVENTGVADEDKRNILSIKRNTKMTIYRRPKQKVRL